MKITIPQQVAGAKDALFVLEVEFPVATSERTVTVETAGPIEALDLRGSGPGGAYQIPMGLERLHVPMRVRETAQGEASVRVRCTAGPERGTEAQRTLRLGPAPATASNSGAGSKAAVAIVLLALLGTAALWLYPTVMGGPSVPSVTGLTEAQARQKLQGAEYVVLVRQEETPDPALHERAVRTRPAGGERLAKGSEVELIIGQPQGRLLTVPALRGQMEGPAVAALEAEGFSYDINYDYEDESRAAGTVTRQSPQEDQLVERGTVIELWVAARRAAAPAGETPAPVAPETQPTPSSPELPDPESLPVQPPDPELPAPGTPGNERPAPEVFQPGVSTPELPVPEVPAPAQPEPEQPKPAVPPPEAPQPEAPQGMVTVPDLKGLTEREARTRLEGLRLMALPDEVEVSEAEQYGKVVRQMPVAGSYVWPATQVFLSLGRQPMSRTTPPAQPETPKPEVPQPETPEPEVPQPETPKPEVPQPETPEPEVPQPETPAQPPGPPPLAQGDVPDVIGLSREKATGDLKRAGLRYRLVLEETRDVPDGQVLSQDPAAGSRQPEGTLVTLLVAQAPPETGVAIPDVIGRTRSDAERILRGESFLVRTTLGGSDPARRDTVLAQSPAGGTRRPGRTWVEIVVGQPGLPVRTPEGGPPPPLTTDGPTAPQPLGTGTASQPRAPGTGQGPVQPGASTPRGLQPVPPVQLPPRDAPPTAMVPVVQGQAAHEAILATLKAGLLPILLVDRAAPDSAPGSVIHQSPQGGLPALPGDLMRLTVYIAPADAERKVDLPSAVGMLLERAQNMFAARGVKVRVIEVEAPLHPYAATGRIAASYPVSLVPRSVGESVTLWVVK